MKHYDSLEDYLADGNPERAECGLCWRFYKRTSDARLEIDEHCKIHRNKPKYPGATRVPGSDKSWT